MAVLRSQSKTRKAIDNVRVIMARNSTAHFDNVRTQFFHQQDQSKVLILQLHNLDFSIRVTWYQTFHNNSKSSSPVRV